MSRFTTCGAGQVALISINILFNEKKAVDPNQLKFYKVFITRNRKQLTAWSTNSETQVCNFLTPEALHPRKFL